MPDFFFLQRRKLMPIASTPACQLESDSADYSLESDRQSSSLRPSSPPLTAATPDSDFSA